MKRLKQPDLWFLVMLLLITGSGAMLLARAGSTLPESKDLNYFRVRHYWQATFDALSASCGVGLLTYSFQDDYTACGRWILTVLGVFGALLFLAAVTHAARRMQTAEGRRHVPHPLLVVGAFLIVQVLALGIFLLLRYGRGDALSAPETAWRVLAAFSSLGWASESQQGVDAWPLALLAYLGALGWPLWLLIVPPLTKRYVPVRAALAMLGGYSASLLLAALLISAFESPRGTVDRPAVPPGQTPGLRAGETAPGSVGASPSQPPTLASVSGWSTRYARSLVQTVSASGAGMPTESLVERDASAGTKVTLSALLLVGGLGGSATGGVLWPLLLWALAGSAAALGWPRRTRPAPDIARWMHAGLACFFLLALLAVIIALGLLLIENWTASRFQPAPTFADALLDASSVVAGGNLSSGLAATVTSRNLLSGIHQSADLYQYGMAWLMLAMLVGRMFPLVILRRLANAR
jgi:Trk-type K+ transport system membrane component